MVRHKFAVLSAVVLTASMVNFAGATSFDVNLASPSGNPADPGWYNGTGNPNGGFTVVNQNGIEVGLRAKLRQSPNVIDSPTSLYNVPAGTQIGSPTRAAWNYEFSIDLRPGGVGTLTLADIVQYTTLKITDVTTGATSTINPLVYFPDNSTWGSAGKSSTPTLSDWGAQNSGNPKFASFPLVGSYDVNAADLYTFQLDVNWLAPNGSRATPISLLASDTISVQVAPVPLPAAVWSGASLLVLVGAMKLIKKRRPSVVTA